MTLFQCLLKEYALYKIRNFRLHSTASPLRTGSAFGYYLILLPKQRWKASLNIIQVVYILIIHMNQEQRRSPYSTSFIRATFVKSKSFNREMKDDNKCCMNFCEDAHKNDKG